MLDLDQPINPNLSNLLREVELASFSEPDQDEFEAYYHRPQQPSAANNLLEPAIGRLEVSDDRVNSYQASEDSYLDPDIVARRRAERIERNKDDPFYIAPTDDKSGTSTPLHNILQSSNGQELDIDAIPIMQLDLGKSNARPSDQTSPKKMQAPKPRQRLQVAADETLVGSGTSTPGHDDSENSLDVSQRPKAKGKHSLLQVDSSHIGSFSLEGDGSDVPLDFERHKREEAEMERAMKDVERLRLEMQRANERIEAAQGVEGTVIKKKKKKPKTTKHTSEGEDNEVKVVKKKPKAKKAIIDEGLGAENIAGNVVKPKKKKKPAKIEESHPSTMDSVA
jgi:AP-3 complex subunit delta-1